MAVLWGSCVLYMLMAAPIIAAQATGEWMSEWMNEGLYRARLILVYI